MTSVKSQRTLQIYFGHCLAVTANLFWLGSVYTGDCKHVQGKISSYTGIHAHLVTVGGTEGMHVGSGPHELHHLHRLVRGSVLSKPDGVVRHDIKDAEPRQSTWEEITHEKKKKKE